LFGPYLDEFKGKGWINVLGLDNGVYTLDGFIDEFLYFKSVKEVQVKFFRRFEVIKQAIQ
jgi:hypothetical protein